MRCPASAVALIVILSAHLEAQIVNPSNGHTYVPTSPGTVFHARAEAASLGGHLVTINDATENAWLVANFNQDTIYWIGLSDETTEGTFVWDNGELVTYTNWRMTSGEPNGGMNENHVLIWPMQNGEWSDWGGSATAAPGPTRGIVEIGLSYPGLIPFQGRTVAPIGDINADGIDDFATGWEGDPSSPFVPGPNVFSGSVRYVSGADGSVIRTIYPAGNYWKFGQWIEPIEDTNADGIGDILVGTQIGSNIEVRSGFDGSLLHAFGLPGAGLEGLSPGVEDFDGDGVADIVAFDQAGVFVSKAIPPGASLLFIALLQVKGVVPLNDISGDGVPDIAVLISMGPNLVLQFHSGADGSFLHGGPQVGNHNVRRAGDANGDGLVDVLASDVGENAGLLISSLDGSLIHTLPIPQNNIASNDGDVDVSADGVPDVVILGTFAPTGREAHFFCGATGTLLLSKSVITGNQVRFVGHLDQDGVADLAIGGDTNAGAAAYVSGQPTGPKLGPCAVSRVGIDVGAPDSTLTVNGSTGGLTHRVDVPFGAPFTIEMAQPQGNPFPAGFAISGWAGVPTSAEETVLPFGLGTLCIPSALLSPGYPNAFTLTSSFGNVPTQLVASHPAPWQLQGAPIPFPIQVTFQGLIVATPVTAALTNAVILNYQ